MPAGFGVAGLGPALLEDPVAFLSAEHGRQLVLLAHLERLVRAPAARGARVMARALLRWLTEELPVHVADEEASLYPRLRPHDAGRALERLSAEHRRDAGFVDRILPGLRALVAGRAPDAAFFAAGDAFAKLHRAHLRHEEATIMPLARTVLAGAPAAALAAEMACRRGLAGTAGAPARPGPLQGDR